MTSPEKPIHILACGEVLWDLFPQGPCLGGAPANFACHASLLGAQVSFLTAVGTDPRGSEALAILQHFGLQTDLIQRLPDAPTGTVGVSLDPKGKPSFEIHPNSAWDNLSWTPALETRISQADAVYFGTLGQRGSASRETIRKVLKLAKARGILRILDVNLRRPFFDPSLIRESIAEANVLKLSDDELKEVASACGLNPEDPAKETLGALLKNFDLSLIIMTQGGEGALLVSPQGAIHQPGIPTQVIDTVGAGDSFTACLCVGLLRENPHADILKKACEIAAFVCSQSGAVPMNPEGRLLNSPQTAAS